MLHPKYILYIDDHENQLSFKALFRRKFPILTTGGLQEAKSILKEYPCKIVLANQNKPIQEIFEFLVWLKQWKPEIIQIFIYSNDKHSFLSNMSNNHKNLTHQILGKPWDTSEMESVLNKWWH